MKSQTPQKLPRVAFILEESLTDNVAREKLQQITRLLRQHTHVEVLSDYISEAEFLEKAKTKSYDLIIAPWQLYFTWQKVEALLGLSRTTGPTFAGYVISPFFWDEIPSEMIRYYRAILFNFYHLTTDDAFMLINLLCHEKKRSGLRPLFQNQTTPIYSETWNNTKDFGPKVDHVMQLPRIQDSDWIQRANHIRICLMALWALIYEEGPGRYDGFHTPANITRRAYFQIGADHRSLVMRLCYTISSCTPTDTIHTFWPNSKDLTRPAQLLNRYADFVRVHRIAETPGDIELVVGFFTPNPAAVQPDQIHTHWIEPLSKAVISELPDDPEALKKKDPRMVPLSEAISATTDIDKNSKKKAAPSGPQEGYVSEHLYKNALARIIELQKSIEDKELRIQELKLGGVNFLVQSRPPEADILLEGLSQRLYEAEEQIQQIEGFIEIGQVTQIPSSELVVLKRKHLELLNKKAHWTQKLVELLQTYGPSKKKEVA